MANSPVPFLLGATLLASFGVTVAVGQQAAPAATLTAEETAAAERAVLADRRVRDAIGTGQPRVTVTLLEPDKAEAVAFLEGRSSAAPERRAAVVLFNAQTNRAARAYISLAQSRIVTVERLAATDVPITRADADDALALTRQNAAVRRAVGDTLDRYELLESGNSARVPFALQLMPLRSGGRNDPCRVDRCVVMLFRTDNGYLPVHALVNLTRRTVEVVEARRQHR